MPTKLTVCVLGETMKSFYAKAYLRKKKAVAFCNCFVNIHKNAYNNVEDKCVTKVLYVVVMLC